MTLTEFLLARIAEDEAVGHDDDDWGLSLLNTRALIAHLPDVDVFRILALPYANHPDYDEAWRP